MFGMFHSREARLFIDRGRVHCPVYAGDVEVDACLECRWLLEVEQDGPTPFVRCQPVAATQSAWSSKRAR
jgi:hypothetical protein